MCFLAEKTVLELYKETPHTENEDHLHLEWLEDQRTVLLFSFLWIDGITGLDKLYEKVKLLADQQTIVLYFNLRDHETDNGQFKVATVVERLGSIIGLDSVLDVQMMALSLQKQGIHTLVIMMDEMNTVSCETLIRLCKIFSTFKAISVKWIVDDVVFLSHLSLPLHMGIFITKEGGRGQVEMTVDVVKYLLEQLHLIPSKQLIEQIKGLIKRPNDLSMLLKLTIFEHHSIEWNVSKDNDLAMIQGSNNGVHADAATIVERLSLVWGTIVSLNRLLNQRIDSSANENEFLSCLMDPAPLVNKLENILVELSCDESVRLLQNFIRNINASNNYSLKKSLGHVLERCVDPHDGISSITRWLKEQLPLDWNRSSIGSYEMFLLNTSTFTSKCLHPRIYESIQLALDRPNFYRDGSLLSSNGTSMSSDTAIVFKLARECGKFINMYDWYASFQTCLNHPIVNDYDEKPIL